MLIRFLSFTQADLINKADCLFFIGQYSKAINFYTKTAENLVRNDKISKAYIELGNYSKALQFSQSNVDLYPDNQAVRYNHVNLLSTLKKFPKSEYYANVSARL